MHSPKYSPLDQGAPTDEEIYQQRQEPRREFGPHRAAVLFRLLLVGSLCLNLALLCRDSGARSKEFRLPASKYVGLVRNVPLSFSHDELYTSSNRVVADAAWNSPKLQSWNGLVALPEDYVQSHGLPPAQKWPWDQEKGLYILNGFHNLHCLDLVRRSILHAYDGKPLMIPLDHVSHCLNVLREEIMCNADDTPRYTGSLNAEAGKEHPTSGIGQAKMCNSWDKLYNFAVENSACYRPVNTSDPNFPVIERYKFCPDGKVLWQ